MTDGKSTGDDAPLSGDELLQILGALANPHRLRILAQLGDGRDYVSRLARRLGISRPLLHMHLQRLEQAGLVHADYEISEHGKALRFYEITRFTLRLTPALIADAVHTLTSDRTKENT